MFKEILKIAFEDLGLQSLPIRDFVCPGVVNEIFIVKNKDGYELQFPDEKYSVGFTMEDEITFGLYYPELHSDSLEIRSNGVRRFFREFGDGLCARFPFTEKTLGVLMRTVATFHVLNGDSVIAYFDTGLGKSGVEFHISDNHLVANLNDHYFEVFTPENTEIGVYLN